MKKLLKKHFGFDEFRPLQEDIIKNVLKKKDTFVLMPTGGGKSLCFQLPALELKGLTLVISPLIALMKDQVDSLRANGINAKFLNSSQTEKEQNDVLEELEKNKIKILYIAPERLALSHFQEFLKTLIISLVAIDEAHCISEWGHDFRPDYRNLKKLKTLFPGIPLITLTATATKNVQDDIVKQLSLKPKIFISSFMRENLNISIKNKKNAFAKLINLLEGYKNKAVIIYCFSRKDTETITEKLNTLGFSALAYHAGLDSNTRKKNQEMFIKDKVNIIVATIAFGMGIDKPDVRLVVHYTFPKTLESYYQEIGRAGRDNLPSECVMFYTYADTRKHEFFIGRIQNPKMRQTATEKLDEVLSFAESEVCRKKHLLKYFGEELKDDCNNCDSCLTVKEKFDATTLAQKILSAVLRTNERFGRNHIIDVLLGKNTQQIRRNNHHELSVYDIINDFSKDDLNQITKTLINLNFIKKSSGKYPTLSITKKGAQFLKEGKKLELTKPKIDKLDNIKVRTDIDFNKVLFEKLRLQRKQIAENENLPPFIIFGDRTLEEMAHYFPINNKNFSLLTGVGELKLKKYATFFITTIKKFIDENDIKTKERKNNTATPKLRANKQKYYEKTIELLQKKTPVTRIAKKRKVSMDTIIKHIEKIIDDEIIIDLEYLKLPKDKFTIIKKAFTNFEDERLKPVFEYLNKQYSYDDIKLVRVLMKI